MCCFQIPVPVVYGLGLYTCSELDVLLNIEVSQENFSSDFERNPKHLLREDNDAKWIS